MTTEPPVSCADDYDPDSLEMQQAKELILSRVESLSEHEEVSLLDSCGRILARDIQAPIDVPGFRNSAMDGYAFRHQDAKKSNTLTLIGTSLAGHPHVGSIGIDSCIKIMTGACVPDALDTVVMQENVASDADLVTILKLPEKGSNIREQGSNIKYGSSLLPKHTRLGAAEMGLLASIGCQQVDVLRRVRVAVFSTGDELREADSSLTAAAIYDSNRYMLFGLLGHPAIEIVDLGICADDESALRDVMADCAAADVVISSGGVSVGDADFIKEILADAGHINLWKIAMKPGRPLTHAVLSSGAQYFGLPGNPVSGLVTFHQFVLPAIELMLNQKPRLQIEQKARIRSAVKKQPGRIELQRGILWCDEQQQWWVDSTGAQDSHVLTSMHRANCYIVLSMDSSGAKEHEEVTTLPFSNYWQPN